MNNKEELYSNYQNTETHQVIIQPGYVQQLPQAVYVPTQFTNGISLLQRALEQPFRILTAVHSEQGYIFVSEHTKYGDNLVQFQRGMLNRRTLFILRHAPKSAETMAYHLQNIETGKNLFISADYKDHALIEARFGIDESRSRFRLLHDGFSNAIQLISEDGYTLFASNDKKHGSYLVEASSIAKRRATFTLEFT